MAFHDLPLSRVVDELPLDDRVRLGCASREMQRAVGILGPVCPTVPEIERILKSTDRLEHARLRLFLSAVKSFDAWLSLVLNYRYNEQASFDLFGYVITNALENMGGYGWTVKLHRNSDGDQDYDVEDILAAYEAEVGPEEDGMGFFDVTATLPNSDSIKSTFQISSAHAGPDIDLHWVSLTVGCIRIEVGEISDLQLPIGGFLHMLQRPDTVMPILSAAPRVDDDVQFTDPVRVACDLIGATCLLGKLGCVNPVVLTSSIPEAFSVFI